MFASHDVSVRYVGLRCTEHVEDPSFIYICEHPVQSLHDVQGKWNQFRVSKKKGCSLGSSGAAFGFFLKASLRNGAKCFYSQP